MMQFAAERSAQTDAMSRSAVGLDYGSLVLAAKNEHSTGFATLSGQYREQLFRAAHRITRSREDAEDADGSGARIRAPNRLCASC